MKIISFSSNLLIRNKCTRALFAWLNKVTPNESGSPFIALGFVWVERKLLKWAKVRFDRWKGQFSSFGLISNKQSCTFFFQAVAVKNDWRCRLMNHSSRRRLHSLSFSKILKAKKCKCQILIWVLHRWFFENNCTHYIFNNCRQKELSHCHWGRTSCLLVILLVALHGSSGQCM